jgi:predicted PurR-regulated permease PerM
VLVCLITATILLLVPQAWREGMDFGKHRMEQFRQQLEEYLKVNVPSDNRDKMMNVLRQALEDVSPAKLLSDAATIFQFVGRTLMFAFLSILLSGMVLWNPKFLHDAAESVRRSRLGWIYDEVAPPVATFFRILGRVFDAQIVIALVNTTLTLAGMLFLGIPGELFLSVVVFFCGLIPVIGAFLSSVPIVITALVQPSGFFLAIKAVMMVLIVHALEAYVLNPRIMGGHLKMHPFTVILTLLVGEHFFGVWGVLLGVPGITYLAHYFAGDDALAHAAGSPGSSGAAASEGAGASPGEQDALTERCALDPRSLALARARPPVSPGSAGAPAVEESVASPAGPPAVAAPVAGSVAATEAPPLPKA